MILIIANTEVNSGFNFIENETFKLFDCKDIYRGKEDGSNVTKKDLEEYYADLVAKAIDIEDNTFAEAIIIDKHLGTEDLGRTVLVAGHIATHRYIYSALDKLPLIIGSWNEKIINELRDLSISNFFSVSGVYSKTYAEIFQIVKSPTGEQENKIRQFLRKNNTHIQWQDFKINYSPDNRHQIANEWGSVKLALNAGYSKEEIKYDWPPTLFFKYLLKKHKSHILSKDELFEMLKRTIQELDSIVRTDSLLQNEKLSFSKHPYLKNKKILLIDDNADKGWEVTLENIFKSEVNSVYTVLDTLNISDYKNFDLVFLDLYLPNPKKDNVPDMDYSKRILEGLKKEYPQIPIIVFTASNKSWTLEEVTEKGADGMYVKESPEFSHDEKYSKENFQSFVKTVIKTLDAYLILRPYWEKIEEIKKNFLPEINDNDLDKQFLSRITERLDMFFGLLKRGMYQHKYDKERFFFSDYELAFMTLWSVLNEVSEACFDKEQPEIEVSDFKNLPISNHPCGESIKYLNFPKGRKHFLWKIKFQEDVFVKYEYYFLKDGLGNPKSDRKFYELGHNQLSEFEFVKNRFQSTSKKKTAINYEKTLYLQIAFLLDKKIEFSASLKKYSFQQNLVRINEIRNQLYLTHGSDISVGFYSKTEKVKRDSPNHNVNPLEDIKDLFELVAFLLTGKEMELIF